MRCTRARGPEVRSGHCSRRTWSDGKRRQRSTGCGRRIIGRQGPAADVSRFAVTRADSVRIGGLHGRPAPLSASAASRRSDKRTLAETSRDPMPAPDSQELTPGAGDCEHPRDSYRPYRRGRVRRTPICTIGPLLEDDDRRPSPAERTPTPPAGEHSGWVRYRVRLLAVVPITDMQDDLVPSCRGVRPADRQHSPGGPPPIGVGGRPSVTHRFDTHAAKSACVSARSPSCRSGTRDESPTAVFGAHIRCRSGGPAIVPGVCPPVAAPTGCGSRTGQRSAPRSWCCNRRRESRDSRPSGSGFARRRAASFNRLCSTCRGSRRSRRQCACAATRNVTGCR
jgi:hypothetical protein